MHFVSAADSTSRPFGTVIANEVFSSGVLLSEYAALDSLRYSGWLTWSRLVRTSANSSNILMFRGSTYVVLASFPRTSLTFTFNLDSRYRQQLYLSYTPGMTLVEVTVLRHTEGLLKDLVDNIQPGVAQVSLHCSLCVSTE